MATRRRNPMVNDQRLGLYPGTQLRPEIPGQCEFFLVEMASSGSEFHRLDIFIHLSDRNATSHESRTVLNTMPV